MNEPNPWLLMEKMLDGSINNDEANEFLAWLKESDENLAMFRSNVRMNLLLRRKSRNTGSNDLTLMRDAIALDLLQSDMQATEVSEHDDMAETTLDLSIFAQVKPIADRRTKTKRTKHVSRPDSHAGKTDKTYRSSIPFVIRLTVFFLFIGWLAFDGYRANTRPEKEFAGLARISETIDVAWCPDGEAFRRGQYINPTKVCFTSGTVKLDFKNGAELLLEGPSELVVNEMSRTFCSFGKVSATIPKTATGFEITTPFARFVDRGTQFAVMVNKDHASLDVVKGQVDTSWEDERPAVLVRGGSSLDIDRSRNVSTSSVRLERFLDSITFQSRLADYLTRKTEEKKRVNMQLDSRPGLIAYFDLSQSTGSNVVNLSTSGRQEVPNAVVYGGARAEGRFAGLTALAIRNRNDRLAVELQKEFTSLTLAARVRIDRLNNMGNVLLAGNRFFELQGEFLWQLLRDGTLQFQINDSSNINNRQKSGLKKSSLDYTCFDSPPVVKPGQTWCWFHLAVVIDGKKGEITHYLDGQPVVTLPWNRVKPLHCDGLTIGNLHESNDAVNARYFDGVLGDFYLFDRALDKEELEELAK